MNKQVELVNMSYSKMISLCGNLDKRAASHATKSCGTLESHIKQYHELRRNSKKAGFSFVQLDLQAQRQINKGKLFFKARSKLLMTANSRHQSTEKVLETEETLKIAKGGRQPLFPERTERTIARCYLPAAPTLFPHLLTNFSRCLTTKEQELSRFYKQ